MFHQKFVTMINVEDIISLEMKYMRCLHRSSQCHDPSKLRQKFDRGHPSHLASHPLGRQHDQSHCLHEQMFGRVSSKDIRFYEANR